MDEYQWSWMYNQWIEDQLEQAEIYKNYSTYIGSFSNPHMAQKIFNKESTTIESSDKDFDEISEKIINDPIAVPTRRRRRVINN